MHTRERITIGLDWNDVIADREAMKLEAAKQLPLLTGEELRREARKLILKLDRSKVLTLPGAIVQVGKFIKRGHKVFVITANGNEEVANIRVFFNYYGLPVEVIGVGHGQSKDEAAVKHGIRAFLDNHLEKLVPLVGKVDNLYLLTRPNNEGLDTRGIARRVGSFKEFGEEIEKIA